MIRAILKSISDRAHSIVMISVLTLILLPGCYTTWDVVPYEPAYPPSTVVIVDGGSYLWGGSWWYGYHGGWYRYRHVQTWQPHRHEYYVAPARPSGNVRTEHQSHGRTTGNRR